MEWNLGKFGTPFRKESFSFKILAGGVLYLFLSLGFVIHRSTKNPTSRCKSCPLAFIVVTTTFSSVAADSGTPSSPSPPILPPNPPPPPNDINEKLTSFLKTFLHQFRNRQLKSSLEVDDGGGGGRYQIYNDGGGGGDEGENDGDGGGGGRYQIYNDGGGGGDDGGDEEDRRNDVIDDGDCGGSGWNDGCGEDKILILLMGIMLLTPNFDDDGDGVGDGGGGGGGRSGGSTSYGINNVSGGGVGAVGGGKIVAVVDVK
ncbi:glycine-rich protein 5-like [Papaver somniferum]|uniref:glycine-rich protein 5-like n=1 Tax=Papaver somniferum TaxID=3469 RepID=UPI000E6FE063|nr:glycine-rich protein 5-like [Papaver somniferum]